MAYRFEEGEGLAVGLKRVADEALGAAMAALRSRTHAGTHEARIALKRTRALLRLIRPVIGDKAFKAKHNRARAIGRSLAGARHAAVHVEVLDELRERSPDALAERAFEDLREQFVVRREAAALRDAARSAAIAAIARSRRSFAASRLKMKGFDAIEPGLRRVYAAASAQFDRARRQHDDAHLHALRKRVKDLGYLMALLEPLWPAVMLGAHEALKQLGDRLGEDRDLALLRADLVAETGITEADRARAIDAIDARRDTLENKIRPLGLRIFAESPSHFTARMGAYWKAWRIAHPVKAGPR